MRSDIPAPGGKDPDRVFSSMIQRFQVHGQTAFRQRNWTLPHEIQRNSNTNPKHETSLWLLLCFHGNGAIQIVSEERFAFAQCPFEMLIPALVWAAEVFSIDGTRAFPENQ